MDINFPFRVNAETFIGVRNHLQVLEIANTSLTLLPSFQLPQLKTLNVSANHLTFVPPETLGRDYYLFNLLLSNLLLLSTSERLRGTF